MQEGEERERVNALPLYIAALLVGASTRNLLSRLNRLRFTRREMEILTQALEKGEAAADILAQEGLPPEEVYDIFSTMALETCIYGRPASMSWPGPEMPGPGSTTSATPGT